MSASIRDIMILDRPPLGIGYLPGRSETLAVAFSGVGTKPRELPEPEFMGSVNQQGRHPALFVSDASRSWMNGPGIATQIRDAVVQKMDELGCERVVALGNSMGGFAALCLAKLMPVDFVLAVVPQFSARQDLVPEETRWRHLRGRIRDWPFPQVPDLRGTETKVLILHGDSADERIHAARFPQAEGKVAHFIFPKAGHNLARWLKSSGHLRSIIQPSLNCNLHAAREAVRMAGGVHRGWYELKRAERAQQEG